MRGLSKRKGSEVWQGKFRIPQRLWDRRDDLLKLGATGIGGSQEFTKSLGARDRGEATRNYRKRLDTWEQLLEAWQGLLDTGPQRLSHQQLVALAAERARAFLTAHEADPFDAPPVAGQVPLPIGDDGSFARSIAALPIAEREALLADLKRYLSAGEDDRGSLTLRLLGTHPALRKALAPDFVAGLEAMHGEQSDEALLARGLHVDAETRRLLNLQMAHKMAAVGLALEERRAGRYRPVPELDDAPSFIQTTPTPRGGSKGVTFEAIIDTQATKRKAGQGSRPMREKTVKKYKRIAETFAAHRGSDDAATVTVPEVEAWLDAMQEEAGVSNRTVADRLVAIGTIINWGKKQRDHRDAMAQAETVSGRVELPSYMEKPADETSYTLEEARTVLLAARREEDASKRWLPWLCLYAGLRISEANTLRKSDFFQAEDLWFFKVTSAGKRSLKTANSERRIPVHSALEAEGFLAWVEAAPQGQLFRDGATSLMGRWVRSKAVGLVRPGLSPNHGLRHLFVGLSRRYGLEGSAAEYLAGHSTQAVHAKYGSSDVMLPGLATEMRKIEPLLELPKGG
ncbi:hypothetical protein [Mesorhizobium silamurunense]|uniref:hypothetical protein n=1 Tax=Mesorhizobium silamurunense TaxID=499528 RepID=UPI00177B5D53|nr:hypothetical protein [Mesorhizobium silamurunense]